MILFFTAFSSFYYLHFNHNYMTKEIKNMKYLHHFYYKNVKQTENWPKIYFFVKSKLSPISKLQYFISFEALDGSATNAVLNKRIKLVKNPLKTITKNRAQEWCDRYLYTCIQNTWKSLRIEVVVIFSRKRLSNKLGNYFMIFIVRAVFPTRIRKCFFHRKRNSDNILGTLNF